MSEIISIEESKRLLSLESVITKGLNNFIEVGEALLEIRDSRLYRIEHGTFEEYCKSKWGMSKRHCDRLISSTEATKNLGPGGPTPTTERQARPLTKLPAEKQPEAWQKAVDSADGKQPTAKQVEAAVTEIITPEPKRERLPKYTPAIAMDIANNAIRMLGTIHDKDTRREEALRMVITYCETELN
jgi:hypothetical protein